MSQDGFLFDQLSEFKQKLMRQVLRELPIETKKFIKDESRKCTKIAKKIAKKEVGTSKGKKKDWSLNESYHKNFKVGKN